MLTDHQELTNEYKKEFRLEEQKMKEREEKVQWEEAGI